MAQQSKSKKYVTLDDVRVSYDPQQDLIQLTSGDEELKDRGGLKIDVNNTSYAYKSLRRVLKDHGVIRGEPWAQLSTEDWLKLEDSISEDEILIGANLNGEPISWDITHAPNLWIYSTIGSGDTIVTGSILSQLLKKSWEFVILELDSYERQSFFGRGVLADNEFAASGAIKKFHSVMQDRYSSLESQEVNSHKESSEPMAPLVLYVEDLTPIYEWARSKDSDVRQIARGFLEGLVKIARLGRAVNIHLVLQTKVRGLTGESELNAALMEEIFDIQAAGFNYVMMGKFSQEVIPKMLHRQKPLKTPGFLGRGTFITYGARNRFAAAHIPQDEYRNRIEKYLPRV